MVRFPWTPPSSFVPPLLSRAASDCPPAPFQAPGTCPSPESLHLLQLGSYLQLACPLPSCFSLSLCLSLKALLPSLFFPLCISDKDSPLWSEQVCPAPHPHSSFPLLLFSLGSLFIPHYCITFLLRDPLSCIITESRPLSQTSPSLAHSEGATTLFQDMSPALLCSLFPSGPLKPFQLCVPPFNVILLEKLSKIFYYATRVTVDSCLNPSSCFK